MKLHREAAAAAVAMSTQTLSSVIFASTRRSTPDIRRRRVMTSFPAGREAQMATLGRGWSGETELNCRDFRLSTASSVTSSLHSHVTRPLSTDDVIFRASGPV